MYELTMLNVLDRSGQRSMLLPPNRLRSRMLAYLRWTPIVR